MTSTAERPLGRAVPYLLAACTGISVLSTDLITPSIPDLPEALSTTPQLAQLTVGVNLAAYALAQLVHGPIADAVGRKRLLIGAMLIFAAITAACALAESIGMLLAGRFLQGLFSSVPSVVIVLIIRELYDEKRALSVMAIYGAALGIAPALGPLIGGYLHVWFGWSAGFWTVAALAMVVAMAVAAWVPESIQVRHALHPVRAVRDYVGLLHNGTYMRPVLAQSLTFGAFFAYITTAPLVFIEIIGLPTERYGLTHLVIVAAYICGNILASRLRERTDAWTLLCRGTQLAALAVVLLLLQFASGIVAVVPAVGAMTLFGLGLAFVLAAGPLVALNAAQDHPQGPASALLGSAQLGIASLAGAASAIFYDGTPVPMAVIMMICAGLGAALIASPRHLSRGSGRGD